MSTMKMPPPPSRIDHSHPTVFTVACFNALYQCEQELQGPRREEYLDAGGITELVKLVDEELKTVPHTQLQRRNLRRVIDLQAKAEILVALMFESNGDDEAQDRLRERYTSFLSTLKDDCMAEVEPHCFSPTPIDMS